MKKLIIILLISIVGMGVKAQFPTTDSLQRFINQYIRNSAVQAFTNLRLNTALNGMLSFVESGVAGIDTAYRVGDSMKIVTAGNDTFSVFVGGSTQWGTNGAKIYYNSGNVGIGTNDPTSQLHIAGASTSILLANTSTVNMLMSATGTGLGLIGNTTNHPLNFQINSGVVMYIGTGGNVAIGSAAPAASAILDMPSTIRGVLLPRMNTAQMLAINSPATSLLIWNTDSTAFCNYNGSAWVKIQGSGGGTIAEAAQQVVYGTGASVTSDGYYKRNSSIRQITIGGMNATSTDARLFLDDTATISGAGNFSSQIMRIGRFDKTGPFGNMAFYMNSFVSKGGASGVPNHVVSLGHNLTASGSARIAGLPFIGIGFESSFDTDSDGDNPWQEAHIYWGDTTGYQYRLLSFIANGRLMDFDAYASVSRFYLKRPLLVKGTSAYTSYFSVDPSVMVMQSNQPSFRLLDTANSQYYTNFQQVGQDLVFDSRRNFTFQSRTGANSVNMDGLTVLAGQIRVSTAIDWGPSLGLIDITSTHANNTLLRIKRNSTDVIWIPNSDNVLIDTSIDNLVGRLQVGGKVTIATVDSTTAPADNEFVFWDATVGELKRAISAGSSLSGLTSTRVTFATSSTTIGDDAGMTYTAATNRLNVDGVNLVTTSTTHAPLNITAFGTLPTSPNAGDVGFLSTDTSINIRVGSNWIPFKWTRDLVPGTGIAILPGSSFGVPDTITSTGGGSSDHGGLTGLSDDDHTQYALLAGRASGQTLTGGTGTTDDLIFKSTSGVGATGALIQFNVGNNGATNAITILNDAKVGIGTATPAELLNLFSSTASVVERIETTLSGGTAVSQVRANSSYWNTTNTGNSGAGGLATNSLGWFNDGTLRLAVSNAGRLSVGGVTTPTAWVHIPANTTTAASIRFVASAAVNVTTPNSGELWWNGTNLYFYNGTSNTDLLAAGAGSDHGALTGLTDDDHTQYLLNVGRAYTTTTGNGLALTTSTLTTGSLVDLASTSTAAGSSTQKVLNIATSGTNGTSAQTTYGLYVSNTHAGTTSTNEAIHAVASGGTTANWAAVFDGDVQLFKSGATTRTLDFYIAGGKRAGISANGATGEIQYLTADGYFTTFVHNVTEMMRINASGVGIGKTPAYDLDVLGEFLFTGGGGLDATIDLYDSLNFKRIGIITADANLLFLKTTTTSIGFNISGTLRAEYSANPGTGEIKMYAGAGGYFHTIYANNAEQVRITSTGVGIGVTASAKLHVSGSVRLDLGSDATGDIFYRNSGGTLTRLGVGTDGFVLTLASGLPTWAASASGMTNPMTSIGDLIQGSTAGAPVRLASVATGNVLISGGVTTASSWGKVGLTTHISGTLPVANGGTGIATTTAYGLIIGGTTSTGAFQNGGTGTADQLYVSGGAAAIGTWTNQLNVSVKKLSTQSVEDADFTIDANSLTVIEYTSLSVARTVTLPDATSATYANKTYIIKDAVGTAGSFNLTINRTSTNLIDGATSIVINKSYGFVELVSDGVGWRVIRKNIRQIQSITSSATPTPLASNEQFNITALAAGATVAAPTGTASDGDVIVIRIKDNGTARTLAWNAIYRASSDLALPTTTIISKTLYLVFKYNQADVKWDLMSLLNNF